MLPIPSTYAQLPLSSHRFSPLWCRWLLRNMLTLVQYEKTLFVDADKICISNMDHLFEEMNTPAGTFSSPWSQPFVTRKDQIAQRKGGGSQRSKYSNSKGMPNPYADCGHNSRVTSSMIYSALTEQSFVVIGTVVLLSPNLEDYEQYKQMLTTLVPFGFEDCHR
jgi:alpha-N-acetylglucosamine transferase